MRRPDGEMRRPDGEMRRPDGDMRRYVETSTGGAEMTHADNPDLVDTDQWWTAPTPVGPMLVVGDGDWVRTVGLPGSFDESRLEAGRRGRPGAVAETLEQIDAYFEGRLRSFTLALQPAGTDFQRRVWTALADISYGETESYGELAARIGNPKACRAVGLANGRNPLPLVLPCHRVIGSNGSLTGYGGGLELKRWLLDHEASVVASGRRAYAS
ncbi:MAG: methylated-DNA--[protein]-cysteine S-methyltransferase [Acidimicrobiales bacterium]